MRSRRQFLSLVGSGSIAGLAIVAGVGCSGEADDPDAFPTIRYGQEHCAHCSMLIDDPRFAAASRVPGSASRHFDDIGCLIDDLVEQSAPASTRTFVHDFDTEAWLRAPEATFVVSPEIRTPMASGIAASTTDNSAQNLAARFHGEVHSWKALRAQAGGGHGHGS